VIQIFGKSGRILCPMISNPGMERLFAMEPAMRQDRASSCIRSGCRIWWSIRRPAPPGAVSGAGKMVMDVMNAGGLIVAGTGHA
jgi:hypothetical protein